MSRDKYCPHCEICEELHGENKGIHYIECPGYNKCIEPYNSFYDGIEANEYYYEIERNI